MRIASIDIGKKNFAMCVQDFPSDLLRRCKESGNEDEIIELACGGGSVIAIDNLDLTYGCNPKV